MANSWLEALKKATDTEVRPGDNQVMASNGRNWLVNTLGLPTEWRQTVADEKQYLANLPAQMGSGAMGSIRNATNAAQALQQAAPSAFGKVAIPTRGTQTVGSVKVTEAVPKLGKVTVKDTVPNTATRVPVNVPKKFNQGGEVQSNKEPSMKGLNLSKFKKIHSSEDTTTLADHNGHQIRIAHKKLNEDMRKQLTELPKFANGGMVNEEENPLEPKMDMTFNSDVMSMDPGAFPVDVASEAPAQMGTIGEGYWGRVEDGLQAPNAQSAPSLPTETPLTNVSLPAETQPTGQNSIMDALPGQVNQMMGIQREANAMGMQGNQELQAAQQHELKAQEAFKVYQQNTAGLHKEIKDITHDYENGHIDPNNFFSSKSDMGKVSTAIGLLLGGIGGGLTGQENPALKFLNQNIDRDIDAQKAEMNKKSNLLNHLYQQLGNEKDAALMAKAVYADIYSNKIAQAAAKAKDPIVQARAQQAIGQIQSEIQKLVGQAGIGKTLKDMNSSDKARYDNVNMGLKAAKDMEKAFKEGDNTFSIVGDNNFTESMRRYAEAFGRLQSGGAINKDEEDRFMAMAPGITDDEDMQRRKLQKMRLMFESRAKTLGVDPVSMQDVEDTFTPKAK